MVVEWWQPKSPVLVGELRVPLAKAKQWRWRSECEREGVGEGEGVV
jgi:hypothetical protein